jgi:hypothetical protein
MKPSTAGPGSHFFEKLTDVHARRVPLPTGRQARTTKIHSVTDTRHETRLRAEMPYSGVQARTRYFWVLGHLDFEIDLTFEF